MPVKFHRTWCFYATDFDPAVIMDSTSHSKASEEQGEPLQSISKRNAQNLSFSQILWQLTYDVIKTRNNAYPELQRVSVAFGTTVRVFRTDLRKFSTSVSWSISYLQVAHPFKLKSWRMIIKVCSLKIANETNEGYFNRYIETKFLLVYNEICILHQH